jgi:hypothetical protein
MSTSAVLAIISSLMRFHVKTIVSGRILWGFTSSQAKVFLVQI